MGCWLFSQRHGEPLRGPVEAEIFKGDQTEKEEYAFTDSLIRETIQNALDARVSHGAVRVRLAIYEAHDAPSKDRLAYYFSRLSSPIKLLGVKIDDLGLPDVPCRFVVVEDFGTRGLQGDTELLDDPPPNGNNRQDFFWFWRNIGRSGKTGLDLGRWGLGKTVFRAASRVGSMLGLTIRASDQRKLLMGQAVLPVHTHQGLKYHPEGYWCEPRQPENVAMPIENETEIEAFIKDWRLCRKDEPGLSVVSPFVSEELRSSQVLQAVAAHFFIRILNGDLEVEVAGSDIGTVTLNQKNIEKACHSIEWDGAISTKRHSAPPIQFSRQCLSQVPTYSSRTLGQGRVPSLSDESFDPDQLASMRQTFAAGELVGVRICVALPRVDNQTPVGSIEVFLQRFNDGIRRDSYYVREGMTIPKLNSKAGKRGVQALVLVAPGDMSMFLGDTEGPKHEDWLDNGDRPQKTWKHGWKGRVKFARRIVDDLVTLLTPPITEPNYDLLSEFFSIPQPPGLQRAPRQGQDQKATPKFERPLVKPRWYRISPKKGGFAVSHNSELPIPENHGLRIAVAYDVPDGNPLKKWSRFDFDLTKKDVELKVSGEKTKATAAAGNIVMLRSVQPNFRFAVEGFDPNRDLYVRVTEVPLTEDVTDD